VLLEEVLRIDPEIRSDIQHFETILRQRRGHGIAGNCFLVSVNIASFVETAIHMEFPEYANNKIIVHIGNLGATRDTGDEWLWNDRDIVDLSNDPGGLPFIPGQGYHSWLTFDDVIIDPTIDFTMEIRGIEQQGPIYFDGDGASHPPKLGYIYRSLRSFGLGDLFRYAALDIR
jgi:hypothetical protein